MSWTDPGPEEVAPGVHRIPLPLPMDGLRAVNVYAVLGREGNTLIDGGWDIDVAVDALGAALGRLGLGVTDFGQCLVTHHHRDHYTLAVGLRQRAGLVVGLGEGEAEQLEWMRQPGPAFAGQRPVLLAAGARQVADAVDALATERIDPGTWSDPDRWFTDKEEVAAAGRTLRVRATPGHTQGHVVYFDDSADIVFAGDHVLPHITPSIGFEPVPGALPLGDFLASLAKVAAMPDLRLLPAHGPVTESSHARVAELVAHHEQRLSACRKAVGSGLQTAAAVAADLPWTRRGRRFADLDVFNAALATLETLAHLELLAARGQVSRNVVDGAACFTPAA